MRINLLLTKVTACVFCCSVFCTLPEAAKVECVMVEPVESPENVFSDETVFVSFSLPSNSPGSFFTLGGVEPDHPWVRIDLIIQNQTDGPIKVLWDSCAFTDMAGFSHRIIHKGVRFLDKDKEQAPSIIPPDGKILDVILNADALTWVKSGWKTSPPICCGKKAVGKTFSVSLAFQVEEKQTTYQFTFRVDAAPRKSGKK